ncbi:phosphoadenosine phosphosulfate reductase family protein [Burkholderia ubonensis]|uniref:phosphoadenosine phosphosulfate reductase family protein n=1 Tax=Burkholderia ubonensis TaxID=101571 RepID=UPI0007C6BF0F|nr:phosphoadenosine phosphosulfate reductase family protein [Burkholderia ubonensis]
MTTRALSEPTPIRQLIVVAYGGGTDSTAMLIEMVRRRMPIDLILFADTGGEKPHTYRYVEMFSAWLASQGYPAIVTVRKVRATGEIHTLEENCLENNMLPSIAYGFKSCSIKFKTDPQDKYCNNWQPARDEWEAGRKVVKLIGYDADESHRAKIPEDAKYVYQYPLVEWVWGRDECVACILGAGLPLPGKSSCFFCPSSRKNEIIQLKRMYPDLATRAVAMESNAELTTVQGLGRRFAWGDLLAADEAQTKLFPESPIDQSCGCYDGAAEEDPEIAA